MGRSFRRPRRGKPNLFVPALLGIAGLIFLVLAVAPIYGSQPPPIPDQATFGGFGSLSDDQLQTVEEISPVKAQILPGDAPLPPAVVARPAQVIREPAPTDALPVTRAQPVSGVSPRAAGANIPAGGPIRVAIVSNLADPATALAVLTGLSGEPDLQVSVADLATLDRPDVLLILDDSTKGAAVWFCGPSPNESAYLASAMLSQLMPLGEEPDDAIGDAVDQSLACTNLHAGRARMAAVNTRLPTTEVAADQLADLLVGGVKSYLTDAEPRIRGYHAGNDVVWPAYGPITSHYGPDHPLGIDIGQPGGDVVAATDGTVTFAGGDPCCSYGLYVIIESPNGITTLYGHLDSLYVHEGEEVHAGQPLGPVGATGHALGVHLHFETLVDGVRVNPLTVLP